MTWKRSINFRLFYNGAKIYAIVLFLEQTIVTHQNVNYGCCAKHISNKRRHGNGYTIRTPTTLCTHTGLPFGQAAFDRKFSPFVLHRRSTAINTNEVTHALVPTHLRVAFVFKVRSLFYRRRPAGAVTWRSSFVSGNNEQAAMEKDFDAWKWSIWHMQKNFMEGDKKGHTD